MRFLLLSLLLLFVYASPDVAAQIVPDPASIELTVEAGQTVSRPLTLQNAESDPVNFSVQTSGGARLFGVGIFDNTIVELDPATGSVLNSFPTPAPAGVGAEALAFDGSALYYANSFVSNMVFKLDPATGTILASVEADLFDVDALAHSGEALYALNYVNGEVYEIDFTTGTTVRTIPLGFDALGGLTWGGARGTLFVGGGDGANTYEIDPADGSILHTLPVGGFFYGMGYSQALGVLFAFDASSNQLLTIDPDDGTVLSSIVPPVSLSGLAADETPGASWLTVTPTEGQIPAGGEVVLDVSVDATDLIAGAYSATITIVSPCCETAVPVTLTVTGEPEIAVAPPSLDFGELFVGASATQTLTVTNTGTDTLFVSGIASSDPSVTADASSFFLVPGRPRAVSVTFAPTAVGPVAATLTVQSNDDDEASLVVPVSGEGTPPPVLTVDPASLEAEAESGEAVTAALAISNTGGSPLTFTVTPQYSAGRPSGRTPPSTGVRPAFSPLRAVGRALSQSSDRYRAPTSQQRGAAGVPALVPAPNAPRRAVGPTVDAPRGGALPTLATDPAGDGGMADLVAVRGLFAPSGFTVELEFVAPVDLASFLPFLAFDVDQDPATGEDFSFLLDAELGVEFGVGVQRGAEGPEAFVIDYILGNQAFAPAVVEGNTIRFTFPGGLLSGLDDGANVAGFTYDFNAGTVSDAVPDSGFFTVSEAPPWLSVTPDAGTVAAGGDVELTVTLDASELFAGTYEAVLIVTTNDPATPTVTVPVTFTVTGEPELDVPTALDFGTVFAGFPSTRMLTVTNTGTDSLTVEVSSSDPKVVVTPSSFLVAPVSARAVAVTVTPETLGAFAFTLTLATNDADEPTVEVAVTGTAAEAPVAAVTPTALTFQVEQGATAMAVLTIENGGGSPLTFEISAQRAALRSGRTGRTAEARPWGRAQAPSEFSGGAAFQARGELPLLYEDAMGDTDRLPDLHAVRGLVTGTDLVLQLEGEGAQNPNGFGGYIGLDVDEDPATGELLPFGLPEQNVGVEFIVDLFNVEFGEVALLDQFFNFVGVYPATVEGDAVTFSLPLADLADDGSLTFAGVIGDFGGPTDWFPESGAIAVGNVDFLTFSPERGTVPAGESTEVTVTVDASGLAVGTYEAELIVATSDPARPTVVVPVTVEVVVGEAGESDAIPVAYALHPLYPNPLRGRATVAFDLPEAASVSLDLYDVQGRRVAALIHGERAPGRHTAVLEAAALPSGAYFCRLQAGSFTATTKVLILR